MTTARLAPASSRDIGWLANVLRVTVAFFTKRRVGRVTTPSTIKSHHPFILGGDSAMEQAFYWSTTLPNSLKNLVSLRAATLIGCPF